MYNPTKVQFLSLAALLRCPMHPYMLRQEIIELTSNKYWPSRSTVSGAIDSLLANKLIQDCSEGGPNYWLKARRGAPYELTTKGRQLIKRELEIYSHVIGMSRMWLNLLGG